MYLPVEDIEVLREVAKENMSGANVLLSGSEGFLGRWFKEILSPICSLRAADVSCGIDITDTNRIGLFGPFDFIIHAAGFASPKVYRTRPMETINVTINGTLNLLRLADRYKSRMLFFSSSEIYGNPTVVPTPEWEKGSVDCRGPRACYDESKRLAETICQVRAETKQTKVITVRPFNVFGPGMKLDDGRVIAAFAKAILNKENIRIYGNGEQTRTYCYISDAIGGFLKALLFGQAGRVYNIGNGEPEVSANKLATTMQNVCGEETKVGFVGYPEDYPADEPQRRCPDITRARNELGYSPTVDLQTGIKKYIEWAKVYG